MGVVSQSHNSPWLGVNGKAVAMQTCLWIQGLGATNKYKLNCYSRSY